MNAAPLLETRTLTLRAAGRCLVDALDWRVQAGERWCVIGRNGAGKSLVLRALAGLGVPERSGTDSPASARSTRLLPAPLRPITHQRSPACTRHARPSTSTRPAARSVSARVSSSGTAVT